MKKTTNIPLLLQAVCLIAYELGVVCALWQNGNVMLTLGVMTGAPVAVGLSRIPRKWFPECLRFIMQIAVAVGGLYWFSQRSGMVQVDIVLLECASVLCCALFIGGRVKEHWLLLFLSFALGLYGGLHPGRDIYFPAFVLLLLVFSMFLYMSRSQSFGAGYGVRSGGNVRASLVHLALAVIFAVLGMRHFVIGSLRTRGILPVSFQTGQEQEFPQLCGQWLKPARHLVGGEDGEGAENVHTRSKILDDIAKNKVFASGSSDFDARNGGGEAQGEELMFRAYTSAKLYWAVQIYDTYDGNVWTRSETLKNGSSELDKYEPHDLVKVTQKIAIMNRRNQMLPYAYRPVRLVMDGIEAPRHGGERLPVWRKDAFNFKFFASNAKSAVPVYTVESLVPAPDLRERPRPWGEPARNFGWNCRTVPVAARTVELRKLALRITSDADSNLEKADAIRDHLRKNYKYNAEAPPIPEDEEAVNYFLFKSREGSCRHFAQAMVLLARLNGMYSRLVTGYSPGNYNMLSNCFEIFQYHSHAWAQVFIEPYGWLTYDGVAPGNLRIGDNNHSLVSLFDPFGDTWKSKSPELASENMGEKVEAAADVVAEKDMPPVVYGATDMLSRIEDRAMKRTPGKEPGRAAFMMAAFSVGFEKLKELWGIAVERTGMFWQLFKDWFKGMVVRFLCLHAGWYVLLSCCLILFLLSFALWKRIFSRLMLCSSALRCAWMWHRACSAATPALCIEYCQRHNSILLARKYRHIPRGDIVERGSVIKDDAMRANYLIVANAAQSVWYSAHEASRPLAERVLKATLELRKA